MVSIQIEQTGKYLDLQGEYVGLDMQVFDLGKIETRTGTVTNDFKIPNTAHNRSALGYAVEENIFEPTLSPYIGIRATCYQNNIPLSEGVIQINDRTKKEIDITFYGENIDVFELIRGKSIRDANLSDLRHAYTAANIIASFSNTSGYIYIPTDYGLFTDRATNDIAEGEIFTSIFFSDVLTAMFRDIGYKVEGTILNRALFKKSVFPFSNNIFGYTKEFVQERGFYADAQDPVTFVREKTTIAAGATVKYTFVRTVSNWVQATYTNELFDLATDTYTANDYYTLKVNFYYDTRLFLADNGSSVAKPTLYIRKNGVVVFTSSSGSRGTSGDISVETGDTIEFYVKNNDAGSILFAAQRATGDVSRQYVLNSVIYPETVLPDMSQVDFLKFILFRFQGVMTVDQASKTVYLNQFNDLKTNAVDDWSGKVDLSKEPETNYTDLIGNYAKRNLALFTSDENDQYQEEYNSDNRVPFGGGVFELDNDFLENEKTLFETPLSPTFLIESFGASNYLIPYIPRYLDPSDLTNINIPEPRVLTVYGKVDIGQVSNLTSLDILGTAVTEVPFAYFYKSGLGFDVDNFKESLAFGAQNIFTPNDLGAFESDYLYLIEILGNPEVKRAYLKLTQIDIINLSFLKKKYFERFGGYFYLNIIEEYDASGNSVKCELVKI